MRPLDGVRIIDLSHALAGPFCTYQLGLLGAEVIKVENTGVGDDFRDFSVTIFDAVNAGKASVTLNLKDRASLKILEKLVQSGDVVVDNFKPGTAEKFGITWETLKAWNPKIIWASISGFGLDGPWRDLPAVEWSVQAASGLTAAYIAEDANRHDMGLGVLDLSTGGATVTAILAALVQRGRTGVGQRLDVAMVDVALNFAATRLGQAEAKIADRRRPAVGRYRTKAGQIFLMGAHQRWFKTISDVLGGSPALIDDPRFATPEARLGNVEALDQAIDTRLAGRTAVEWEVDFTGAGMPAAAVRDLSETLASPHIRQRGVIHRPQVADRGETAISVGAPYRLEARNTAPNGPVPALGADTDRVLSGLGYGADELAALRASGVI